MSDKELIKQEIERLKEHTAKCGYPGQGEFENGNREGRNWVCDKLLSFIDSLPEESGCEVNFTTKSKDLEEELERFAYSLPHSADGFWPKDIDHKSVEARTKYGVHHDWSYEQVMNIARHFAEWQKQQDEKLFKEDTWNYIEEQYPDVTKEEKLRLYDVSIKSRLAGANAIKQQMKETLQTEYEKGRFDMREEMMKDAVEGTVKYEIGSAVIPQCDKRYQVLSDQVHIPNAKLGDKVKIIILKTE